nr:bzip transcription factor 16 [Ipomoea batatas]
MGSSERDKSPKEAKEPKTPSSQEQATTTGTVNPEWPGFQAFSPVPPHGFLASSPQAHPYMWGVQVSKLLYFNLSFGVLQLLCYFYQEKFETDPYSVFTKY